MSWIGWIVFGALAGWVASLVLGRLSPQTDQRRGCLTNMVVGILGSVLAGFIYQVATGHPWDFTWSWRSFGVGVLGSLLLLLVINLVMRTAGRGRR